MAKRRRYEGTVRLELEVLETGDVGEIKILDSSGHAVLDRSAVKTVKKWTFFPGTKNGEAITQWHSVAIRFDYLE